MSSYWAAAFLSALLSSHKVVNVFGAVALLLFAAR